MDIKTYLEENLKKYDLEGCEITDEDIEYMRSLIEEDGLSKEDAMNIVLRGIREILN